MGLMLAEPGFHTHAFVEWEEYPRQSIIAAQHAGYFAPAPIWDDVTTFDGQPLRGAIDTILAGYPCQPFSAAGQRKGADDERHLWPDVARVIREVDPEWVFLENVAGHVSLGLETVLRDLWDMGRTPAVGLFSAGETGAPHERLRVFIVAHRERGGREGIGFSKKQSGGSSGDASRCRARMANSNGENASTEWQQRGGQFGLHQEDGFADRQLANASVGRSCGPREGQDQQPRRAEAEWSGYPVGHPAGIGCGEGRSEPSLRGGRDTPASAGGAMADASGARATIGCPEPIRGCEGQPVEPFDYRRPIPIFPPGPSDMAGWAEILADDPLVAPALSIRDVKRACDHYAAMVEEGRMAQGEAESELRRAVDGLSKRSSQLRLLGNAVVPLQAALAWVTLAGAHGLERIEWSNAKPARGNFKPASD